LGTKPSAATAVSTACFLASLTTAVPLRIRDTVLGDTPAERATISSVTVVLMPARAALARRGRWLSVFIVAREPEWREV
jgi:hypothetical protein